MKISFFIITNYRIGFGIGGSDGHRLKYGSLLSSRVCSHGGRDSTDENLECHEICDKKGLVAKWRQWKCRFQNL